MACSYTKEISEYVESNLIAYIGNKRRLIHLIRSALEKLNLNEKRTNTFYDPFSGTGVISRLAKAHGFKVVANDWEYYSQIINRLFIETDKQDLNNLFKNEGGLDKVLDYLNNSIKPMDDKDKYIAKYYCPEKTENPNLEQERLFYTQETGEKIDAIRNYINEKYEQGNPLTHTQKKEKNLLLALLLYEAATRSNTSGVFKAFHRGFGGRGKDALSRILKPLALPKPILWDNNNKHKVFCAEAGRLTKKLSKIMEFDVAYLDPPYNQHQYGSNYHLLNTIAKNDKPKLNKYFKIDGKIVQKGGIREDWTKTKSDYCYKNKAQNALTELIENLKAHYILVSYSIDGIISLDEILSILSKKGKLEIVTDLYVKYRGGKQALKTEKNNIEMVFIVNTHEKSNKNDILRIKNELLFKQYELLTSKVISIPQLKTLSYNISGSNDKRCVTKTINDYSISWHLKDSMYFIEEDCIVKKDAEIDVKYGNNYKFSELPYNIKKDIVNDIKDASNIDKEEELLLVLDQIEYYTVQEDIGKIIEHFKRVPFLFKKFNNRKNMIKSLSTIQIICKTLEKMKIRVPELVENKKFNTDLEKLHKIIIDKLDYKAFYITTDIIRQQQKLKIYYANFLNNFGAKLRYNSK